MTTPSDPTQPGDGSPGYPPAYPAGAPGYPTAPPLGEIPPAPAPPNEIVGAFWAFVLAAVIGIVGGLLVLGTKQTIVDAVRAANTSNLTETQIQAAANIAVITAVVISVIIGALYVLFAFKLKAGRNWARIVLTIVAVLSLISLLAGGHTLIGYVGVLAAAIGAVLSYLPNSSAYITAVKRSRG